MITGITSQIKRLFAGWRRPMPNAEPQYEVHTDDPQKRFAEQRRADIERRRRALELMYDAQARLVEKDHD